MDWAPQRDGLRSLETGDWMPRRATSDSRGEVAPVHFSRKDDRQCPPALLWRQWFWWLVQPAR